MNAAGRRAELIRILRIRRKDIVANLAREFSVNEKTIRRDLLILTVDEGHLIDTIQGNGGGVVYNGQQYPHRGILTQEQIRVLNEMKRQADSHQAIVIDGMLDAFS